MPHWLPSVGLLLFFIYLDILLMLQKKQNKVPKIWYKIQALCYGFDEVDFHARINDFPSFMVSCLENIRLKLKSCCPQGNSLSKKKDTEEASNYRGLSYLK